MSTIQTTQDEIAAMQATLARHEEDLERLKQWLPESGDATGSLLQSIIAELTATRDGISRELSAIHERLDALEAAQANTDREIAGLKDDVAGLKDAVARLEGAVARLEGEVASVKGEVASVKGEVASVKGEVASVKGEVASVKETLAMLVERTNALVSQYDAMSKTMTVIESRVGNLTGSRLERRVARNIRGTLRRAIGLSQARVLHRDWGETDDDLIDLLDDADERGAITRQEREDVLDADLIAAGANPDGPPAYAVAEIGVTVDSVDINRAARRARTITKATGAECTAIVVGSEIPDAERERATRAGVAVIAVATPED